MAERHPALRTRLCALTGVEVPIVQTGMGWVSGARLTAATAAAGGLGLLASVTMTFDEMKVAVGKVRERTDRPFGVNFRADQSDLDERLVWLADRGVRVFSFAGAPTRDAITRIHDAGGVVIPTIGARRHAEKMVDWGVDAVIAQGGEGGGHTGEVATTLLVPQVVDAVGAEIPVIAAGGFHDGRGLVAALAFGADGIAMGTRFLLTRESHVPDHVKARYVDASVTETVRTTAVDGAPQRVLRTAMVEALESGSPLTRLPRALRNAVAFARSTGTSPRTLLREGLAMRASQDLTWAQLAMAANAPMMTRAAMVDGDADRGILPTGQVCGVIDAVPTVAEVIDAIVADATTTLTNFEALWASDPHNASKNEGGGA